MMRQGHQTSRRSRQQRSPPQKTRSANAAGRGRPSLQQPRERRERRGLPQQDHVERQGQGGTHIESRCRQRSPRSRRQGRRRGESAEETFFARSSTNGDRALLRLGSLAWLDCTALRRFTTSGPEATELNGLEWHRLGIARSTQPIKPTTQPAATEIASKPPTPTPRLTA